MGRQLPCKPLTPVPAAAGVHHAVGIGCGEGQRLYMRITDVVFLRKPSFPSQCRLRGPSVSEARKELWVVLKA